MCWFEGLPKLIKTGACANTSSKTAHLRSGGKDLGSSQTYPWEFGHRIARLHCEHMEAHADASHRTHYCNLHNVVKAGYKDPWVVCSGGLGWYLLGYSCLRCVPH